MTNIYNGGPVWQPDADGQLPKEQLRAVNKCHPVTGERLRTEDPKRHVHVHLSQLSGPDGTISSTTSAVAATCGLPVDDYAAHVDALVDDGVVERLAGGGLRMIQLRLCWGGDDT